MHLRRFASTCFEQFVVCRCRPGCVVPSPLAPLGVCQMVGAYVIAGATTALYTCIDLRKVTPYVDVVVWESASICFSILSFNPLTCSPQRSFWSTIRPRILIFASSGLSISLSTIVCVRSNLLDLERCIRWYFRGAKVSLWRLAQSWHES
jgi:hypothetical protein